MTRYLQFAARHPYLVAALIVVLFLPWLWMAAFLPRWALLTALALVPLAAPELVARPARKTPQHAPSPAPASGKETGDDWEEF